MLELQLKFSETDFFSRVREATNINPILYESDEIEVVKGVKAGKYLWLDSIHNIQEVLRQIDNGLKKMHIFLIFYNKKILKLKGK